MKTPFLRIEHDGVDLGPRWGPLLRDLTITDERGLESDKVAVTLDDGDGRIAYPRTGEQIRVECGYLEVGAVVQGDYTVDQVDLSGWPQQITLNGAAVDAKATAKERRTEAHQPPEVATLGALAEKIAARNGWTSRVAADLAAKPIEYEGQSAESDPAFLGRVAGRHGGLVTIKQGHLVVAPRSGGRTVSGQALPVLTIRPGTNLLEYRVSWKDRESHGAVKARAFDRGQVEPVTVTAGDGTETVSYQFREPFQSRAAAQAAAEAKAADLKRGEGSASFTLEGDPAMGAERPVEVVGVRTGVDGLWTPTRVEHRWEDGGYTTVVECETPGGGDSRGAGPWPRCQSSGTTTARPPIPPLMATCSTTCAGGTTGRSGTPSRWFWPATPAWPRSARCCRPASRSPCHTGRLIRPRRPWMSCGCSTDLDATRGTDMAEPITWEALGAVVAAMGGLGMATVWIVGEIGKSRRESADGRDRIYRRLDEITKDMSETYARKDVQEANFRTVHHALEETNRILTAMAGRVCPLEDMSRSQDQKEPP